MRNTVGVSDRRENSIHYDEPKCSGEDGSSCRQSEAQDRCKNRPKSDTIENRVWAVWKRKDEEDPMWRRGMCGMIVGGRRGGIRNPVEEWDRADSLGFRSSDVSRKFSYALAWRWRSTRTSVGEGATATSSTKLGHREKIKRCRQKDTTILEQHRMGDNKQKDHMVMI